VLSSDERTRAIVTSVVLQHVQATAATHKADVVEEAVLYAAGLVAFRLRWPEQGPWLVDSLLPHLTDAACPSIVQKRAAWTCARFLADFSPLTRPLACQALLHAVEYGNDLAVRVCAAEALGDFIRDVDFDPACVDATRVTRATLVGLEQAESTEAKVKMLDVLMVLSDKLGARYFRDALGEHCLQTLGPHVYAADGEDAGLIKVPLLRLMRVILGALGYENVQADTQAVVRKVVEWTLAKEVGFTEDGLALWLVDVLGGRARRVHARASRRARGRLHGRPDHDDLSWRAALGRRRRLCAHGGLGAHPRRVGGRRVRGSRLLAPRGSCGDAAPPRARRLR